MREDGVYYEGEGDGELRDVEVNCQPQGAGEMMDDLRDFEVTKEVAEDVGHTEIEEDGDVHSWTESRPDDSMDESADNLLDVSIDCDIDDELRHKKWSGNVDVEVESGSRGQSTASRPEVNQSYDTDVEDDVRGLSDNEWISDEYMSDVVDSDDEGYGNFGTFTMPKTMTDYKWEVGTYFTEKEELLEAIKCYALENWRNIKFVKNDKRRVRLRCIGGKGKCPWTAYCGYMKAIKTWQLRRIVDNHTCSREFNLRVLSSKWLGKKLEKTVRENPRVKGIEIREKISRKWNVGISKCMAYRAKAIAAQNVEGSFKEQYKRIYDYAHELLARNPGSTMSAATSTTTITPAITRCIKCQSETEC